MKTETIRWIMHPIGLSAALVLSGCGSGEVALAPAHQPPSHVSVGFENTEQWNTEVAPEGDDLEAVTAFAVSLGKQGRHAEAADILVEQAGKVKSKRNALNIQLYLSAANEYLKAGDMAGFARSLNQAEDLADRFQRAAWGEQTRRLLELRDRHRSEKGAVSEQAFIPICPDGQTIAFTRAEQRG